MVVDDVKVILKDTIRAARFSLRSAGPHAPPVPRPLTTLADGVLTQAEGAIRVVAGRVPSTHAIGRALALGRKAALEPASVDDRTVRSLVYLLVKALIEVRGVSNALLAERALVSVARSVLGQSQDPDRFAAALAIAVRAASPIRQIEPDPTGGSLDRINAEIALALGLAIATAVRRPDADAASVLASADMAAGAAADRCLTILAAPDPVTHLAAAIAEIAPYLP